MAAALADGVAVVSGSSAGSPAPAFTPPDGWTLAATNAGTNITTSIYYFQDASDGTTITLGGRTSETFTTNISGNLILQLAEYANIAVDGPVDKTALAGGLASAGDSVSTGITTATSTSDELVVTSLTSFANTTFSNPTSSFVQLSGASAGNNLSTYMYERLVHLPGAYGHTATIGATGPWVGLVVTFRMGGNQSAAMLGSQASQRAN